MPLLRLWPTAEVLTLHGACGHLQICTADDIEQSFFKPMVSMFVNADNGFNGLVEISLHEKLLTGKNMPLTLVSKDAKKFRQYNSYIVPAFQYVRSACTIVSFKLYIKEVDWLSKNLIEKLETKTDRIVIAKSNFLQCAVKYALVR